MNTPRSESAATAPAKRSLGRVTFWVFATLILMLFLLMSIGPGFLETPTVLVLGWIWFLARTVPAITWNWDILGMSAVCIVIILFTAHRFFQWLTRSIAASRGVNWDWPWRWTWTGMVALGVSFLVGMAVGGIAHQTGWITSSSGSWYVEKRGFRSIGEMKNLDLAWRMALEDAEGDWTKARTLFKSAEYADLLEGSGGMPLLQRYHILVVRSEDEDQSGTIIFPRVADDRVPARGIYRIGGQYEFFPLERLPELIERRQTNLFAL